MNNNIHIRKMPKMDQLHNYKSGKCNLFHIKSLIPGGIATKSP